MLKSNNWIPSEYLISSQLNHNLTHRYTLDSKINRLILGYLLFSDFVDSATGFVVLSRDIMRVIHQRAGIDLPARYVLKNQIQLFSSETGVKLQCITSDYTKGLASSYAVILDDDALNLLDDSFIQNRKDILFVEQKIYKKYHETIIIKQLNEIKQTQNLDDSRPNASLIRFLNSQHSSKPRNFEQQLAVARFQVRQLNSRASRLHQARILNSISLYFTPIYQQVENSERIYTHGLSIAYLKSSIRKTILKDCISIDIKGAHLRIAATLWGSESLNNLTNLNNDFWEFLLDSAGLDSTLKPILKTAVYSSIYGMPESNIRANITKSSNKSISKKIMQLHLMQELLLYRQHRLKDIEHKGFIIDAYGRKVTLEQTSKHSIAAQARSLLAREISSYEFKAMSTIFPYIQKNSDWIKIVLWLHDGVYLKFRNPSRAKQQLSHIINLFSKSELAHKFNLSLSTEYL